MLNRVTSGRLIAVVVCFAWSASLAQQQPQTYTQLYPLQSFDRVVVIGDSLSDNGNLSALTGGRFPGPNPFYFNGRFSNGPVWAEFLHGGPMSAFYATGATTGNVNTAIGGARTDVSVGPAFGIPQQITDFRNAGGTIGANDLVTLWGGANNIFQGGSPITAAQAQTINLNRLIGPEFGARTILVPNLPNLGGTPEAPNPAAGLQATLAFNQTLDQGVRAAAAANPGVNIVQMDVFASNQVLLANPRAFGFTNVTDRCQTPPTICSNPDEFVFWDAVHPTARVHELIALYARLLLATEEIAPTVAPLAESSFTSRLDASSTAFGRTLSAVAFPDQWRRGIYAEIVGTQLNADESGATPSYDQTLGGVRAGVTESFGESFAGLSIAYLTGEHSQANLSADIRTVQADFHAATRFRQFFLGAEAGLSYTSFDDIKRFTGHPTVFGESDTEGWSYSAAASAGLVLDMGGVKLIPNARLGYLTANIDAFSESAPILALEYADRDISSGFWSLGVRAAFDLHRSELPLTAYAEIGYESLFATDTDDVTAHLVDNTALPVSADIDDPASRGLYLKLGVSGHLDAATTLSVDYGLSLPDGDSQNHTGKVQLKFLFGG